MKAGRPKANIDLQELEKLAAMQATGEEIARWFKVGHATWERRAKKEPYRSIIENGRAIGKVSVRRRQFELAMAGDKTMLVWLGKQWLGQRDNLDSQVSGPNGGPIEISSTARESLARRIAGIAERARKSGSARTAE